jgi:hypothetical protein
VKNVLAVSGKRRQLFDGWIGRGKVYNVYLEYVFFPRPVLTRTEIRENLKEGDGNVRKHARNSLVCFSQLHGSLFCRQRSAKNRFAVIDPVFYAQKLQLKLCVCGWLKGGEGIGERDFVCFSIANCMVLLTLVYELNALYGRMQHGFSLDS